MKMPLPRILRMVAFAVTGAPLTVMLLAQALIWVIPGCNPNPYALGVCAVGPYNMASPLMVAGIGGGYIALLSVLVSGPLLLLAWFLSRRSKKGAAANGLAQ
ncbi:hypothetical protein J7E70_34575 [Variovorax paradoxus]|nr:hypothetical protein [Variovorax paradoxus]